MRVRLKYTGTVPINIGLAHPSIAPYGAFPCSDGKHILLSIQNEREWERLCTVALGRPDMATDERYNEPNNRVENRSALDAEIAEITSTFSRDEMVRLILRKRNVGACHIDPIAGLRWSDYSRQRLPVVR